MPSAHPPLYPCLWFDGNAEAAVDFYRSVFKDSRVLATTHWGDVGPGPKGAVLVILFELRGQKVMALNGGPQFKFNEAVSMVIDCENQEEIDYYWRRLTEGGSEIACGWCKDKFGLAWQIAPRRLAEMLRDPDTAKADRAMAAMMQMVKIDLAKIEAAYAGR